MLIIALKVNSYRRDGQLSVFVDGIGNLTSWATSAPRNRETIVCIVQSRKVRQIFFEPIEKGVDVFVLILTEGFVELNAFVDLLQERNVSFCFRADDIDIDI